VLAAASLLAACTGSGDAGDPATVSGQPTSSQSAAAPATANASATASQVTSDTAPLFAGKPPVVSVTGSAAPDLSSQALVACTPPAAAGDTPLIDDLEDGDTDALPNEGRAGGWYTYEETAGNHSFENVQLETPRLGSTHALHTVAGAHGAWAGLGVSLSACVYNAAVYKGLHFWIKGAPTTVNVSLTTPGIVPVAEGGLCTKEAEGLCWDSHRAPIDVVPGWKEYFVPWDDFNQVGFGVKVPTLDLTRIRTIEFQSESGAFEFWLDDLSFYTEVVYTPYTEPTASVTSPVPTTTATAVPTAQPSAESDSGVIPPETPDDASVDEGPDASTAIDDGGTQ